MLPNPDYKAGGRSILLEHRENYHSVFVCPAVVFRATLFHLGVMIGLHRAGLLERVDAIAAVSGGSIPRPGQGRRPQSR